MEEPDEGMSTKKKIAAGAALSVAVPTAVGVAKKLLGNSGGKTDVSAGESRPAEAEARAGSTSSAARSKTARSRARTSGSQRSSTAKRRNTAGSTTSRGSGGASKERTKEQLYAQAKRLGVEGRSKMTKAQLQRAVTRAKS